MEERSVEIVEPMIDEEAQVNHAKFSQVSPMGEVFNASRTVLNHL